MSRIALGASLSLLLSAGVVLTGASPASASTTTGWATWTPITGTSNDYATTMQLPAQGFPKATVATDSRGNVALPSGVTTFLGGTGSSVPTAVGIKYGSSKGHSYLNLRPKADNASSPSTTTYVFDNPTPASGWAFVLGDVDADQVRISAKDADGTPLTAAQINDWKTGHDVFNYDGGSDLPSWDASTSTLVGNPGATDTDGASAWFEPTVSISSLTFVFTRRAGFPVYQTWFASVARTISGTVTDGSTGGGSCPVDDGTLHLIGPDGDELDTAHPVNGDYSFGQYATQAGYVVSIEWPAGCAVVGASSDTVSTATADATADFTVRQILPEPVSGTVRTAAGDPVAGVEITLTPPGGGTPTVITTDVDGNYLIDDNSVGTGYTVAVTGVPDGYAVSSPSPLTFDVAIGTAVTGKDFVLAEQPSVGGTITGGGGGLGGVTVTLTPTGGGTPITTITLGDGSYVFPHVPAGDYDISVMTPPGFDAVAPRTGVTVGASDVTGQDFALSRPGALGGLVTSGSVTGAGVSGVTVTVSGSGGSHTLSTNTAGEYFLGGLAAGTYTITLTPPSGYHVNGPSTHTVSITDQGEDRGGQNFVVAAVVSTSPTSGTSPTSSTGPAPVQPGAGDSTALGSLANTGFPTGEALLLAAGLIAFGLLTLRLSRRRGRRTAP